MKKAITIIIVILTIQTAYSQQTARFNQLYLNPYLSNPGYAGFTDESEACVIHRNDMTGVRGAPKTDILAVDGKYKKYNFGLGMNIFSDRLNILARKGVNISYSYQLKLKDEQKLHFGVSLGLVQSALDHNEIIAETPDELLKLYNYKPTVGFNSDFGLVYALKKFELGFSANNLFNRKKFSEKYGFAYQQNPTYNVTGLYRTDISNSIKNTSFISLLSSQGLPVRFDLSSVFLFKDKMWTGLSYGHNSYVGISGGIKFESFIFGYVYEFPLSQLAKVSSGGHEILLGYNFSKKD